MSYVNLLPDDYLTRRAQRRANLLCAGLFGLVMVGVVAATVVSEQTYGRTREVNERVDRAYAEAGRLIEQLQELEGTKQRMLRKARLTTRLLERVPRSYLLAVVTNALPRGASLAQFELESKRHETTVVSKKKTRYAKAAARKQAETTSRRDVTLTITGRAGTDVEVARFIASVARCPLMESVDLVYSEEKEVADVPVREFQVVLRLRREAEVPLVREGREVAAGGPATSGARGGGGT